MARVPRPEQIEVVSPEVAAIRRRNGGAASVEMVGSAWRMMRDIIDMQTRRRHPDWSDAQVAREVARRMLNGST